VRTTLTLDDDVAKLVQEEVRRSGGSFKGTVNRLLRLGLNEDRNGAAEKPFVITPFPISEKPGRNYDKISELLEELEGPSYR
jgi:hypothetical protein